MNVLFSPNEIKFLKALLKETLFFYKDKLKPAHFSLVDRGYIKIIPSYCGPLKIKDEGVVGTVITEAGRHIMENLND